MRDLWHWPRIVALLASGGFLIFDLAFFAANLLKLREGGWLPLSLGIVIFTIMTTWRRGVQAVHDRVAEDEKMPADFLADLKSKPFRACRAPRSSSAAAGSSSPSSCCAMSPR